MLQPAGSARLDSPLRVIASNNEIFPRLQLPVTATMTPFISAMTVPTSSSVNAQHGCRVRSQAISSSGPETGSPSSSGQEQNLGFTFNFPPLRFPRLSREEYANVMS